MFTELPNGMTVVQNDNRDYVGIIDCERRKNGRVEYYFQGSGERACSLALMTEIVQYMKEKEDSANS